MSPSSSKYIHFCVALPAAEGFHNILKISLESLKENWQNTLLNVWKWQGNTEGFPAAVLNSLSWDSPAELWLKLMAKSQNSVQRVSNFVAINFLTSCIDTAFNFNYIFIEQYEYTSANFDLKIKVGRNLPNVSDRGVKCWNVFLQHYTVRHITEENISDNFRYILVRQFDKDMEIFHIFEKLKICLKREREKPPIHCVPVRSGKIRRWIKGQK